jgi:hypothetical protein
VGLQPGEAVEVAAACQAVESCLYIQGKLVN